MAVETVRTYFASEEDLTLKVTRCSLSASAMLRLSRRWFGLRGLDEEVTQSWWVSVSVSYLDWDCGSLVEVTE